MQTKTKIMMIGVLAIGFALTYIRASFAQDETATIVESVVSAPLQSAPVERKEEKEKPRFVHKEEPEVVVVETVSGEVAGITQTGISIIYNRNYETNAEYEIFVPIDKRTTLKHLKSLDELKEGDLISIEYQKSNKNPAYARVISFIQHAVTAGLVSKEELPADEIPDEVI